VINRISEQRLSHLFEFESIYKMIESLLYGIQLYWSSIFTLCRSHQKIEQLFNAYLGCCLDEKANGAKVNWLQCIYQRMNNGSRMRQN
jgi:hypothetical protein